MLFGLISQRSAMSQIVTIADGRTILFLYKIIDGDKMDLNLIVDDGRWHTLPVYVKITATVWMVCKTSD